MNTWMVRAGEDAYFIEGFLNQKVVAIGWNQVGNLNDLGDINGIKARVRKLYPNYKDGKVNISAAHLYKFRDEFQKGDNVITYDPRNRVYWLGEIASGYVYDPTIEQAMPNVRRVIWKKSIERDSLSPAAKNSLGAIATLFRVPPAVEAELFGKSEGSSYQRSIDPVAEAEAFEEIKEDTEARALEFIKDKLSKLDWEEMQELVAGILRGMGYKTLVSPRGADRGKDIIASPDGLGLENPKIIVEVKHRVGSMGGPELRSFIGGLRSTDRGLFVSSGGFTKDAKYEADRAPLPVTLVDLDMLVLLITQHYDNFDSDTKALIPLKKIYWPIQD